MKYVLYDTLTGKVTIPVKKYRRAENGDLYLSTGVMDDNVIISAGVDSDIFEISDEQWSTMDSTHLDRYLVKNGEIQIDETVDYYDKGYEAGYEVGSSEVEEYQNALEEAYELLFGGMEE